MNKKNHICHGKKKCKYCKQIVDVTHKCFIPQYKNAKEDKKPKRSYPFVFYDFECRQDKGEHSPNYCIAHRACDLCIHKDLAFQCPTCSAHPGGREICFEGENTLSDFCTWLFSKEHKGVTAIAHNFKGYDGQFILRHLVKTGTKQPEVIMNGNNIIQMHAASIRLIDSLNFIGSPLSAFPQTFGLDELKKGYFPHWANTDVFQNYVGPYLDAKYYKPEIMSKEGRAQFYAWYNERVKNRDVFNFHHEMISYCRSDVDILRRGCGVFRDIFKSQGGLDPFLEAATIADACNKVWRSKFMPSRQIGIVSSRDPARRRFSLKALRWLQSVAHVEQITIRHAKNGGEHQIGNYSVDGFDFQSNTVYEFLGDLWHGCPQCYQDRTYKNPITGETMESVYKSTMVRLDHLKSLGYNVITMWEHDFDQKVKTDSEYKELVESLFPYSDPIEPRDALYGGRCNSVKLFHEVDESTNTEIKYVDVCSLYPYVCKYGRYPVGHPVLLTKENINMSQLDQYNGLIKCKILPPQDLFLPILPLHCNKKMVFPLCKTCADENLDQCSHNEEERALVGTWVTVEVQEALKRGYVIMDVYEIWHFQEMSDQFFAGYIDNFLKIKQEASGYPEYCKTEADKKQFVRDYYLAEKLKLDPSNIKVNKGMRAFAKIMLNCLWGKLAQREILTQTKYIKDPKDYFDMMVNPDVLIKHVEIFEENCPFILVNYESTLDSIEAHSSANVIVASFVTTYARLKLYSILEKLNERVLYFDTDSCMYIHDPQQWNPTTKDSRLGEWTDEEPGKKIVKFIGLGPKNYAYQMKNKDGEVSSKCKVKGLTLDYNTSQFVNFDTFYECVQNRDTFERVITYDCRIRKHRDRTVVSEAQTKTFRSVYTKRVVTDDYNTIPFGYKQG